MMQTCSLTVTCSNAFIENSKNHQKVVLSVGGEVLDGSLPHKHRYLFAVIEYDYTRSQFVFSAKQYYDDTISSYICQLQQQGLSVITQPHSTECSLSAF